MRNGQSSLRLALLFFYLPFLFLEAFIWTLRMAGRLGTGGAPGMLDPSLPTWLAFISNPLFGLLIVCAGVALVAVSGREPADSLVLDGQASTTDSPTGFPWFSTGGITILASLLAVLPLLWNSLMRARVTVNTPTLAVSTRPAAKTVPPAAPPSQVASVSKSIPQETWKPLTATQQAHLALLFSSKRASVRVVSIPQDDAFALAKGLHTAFRQAGWVMENPSVDFFLLKSGTAQQGKICVVVQDPHNAAVARIQSALEEVLQLEPCTRANRGQPEDEITVEVWPKK